MSDFKILMLGASALAGLAYCLWKTQADWQSGGFNWRVLWGAIASLNAFVFLAFLLIGSVLSDL